MIEQATERRLAGDWRGVCAAANVDVGFDPAAVANKHGTAVAAQLENDLCHFAPDLLRWHFPRLDHGNAIVPDQAIILGQPGEEPDAPYLHLKSPSWFCHGPQRLRLDFGSAHGRGIFLEKYRGTYLERFQKKGQWPWRYVTQDWRTLRHLWDVRHAGELRERCGGDKARIPFFHSDGTPRTATELPTADPGRADPVAFTEWVTLLHERGEVKAAFAAAGIEFYVTPIGGRRDVNQLDKVDSLEVLARMPLALSRLEAEIRRLAETAGSGSFWILYRHRAVLLETIGPNAGLRVRVRVRFDSGDSPAQVVLPEACWRRLPDLDLLRDGHPPEQLHPLVRDALFPDRVAVGGPARPAAAERPAPVRVRCHGEWHEMSFRDGVLQGPHSVEEERRESAMRAFGGKVAGCFATQEAWRTGTGWLPKALRHQRDDLFARVQHGDLPGVLRLLDAGMDPLVRDNQQRTLLHKLHLLDPHADPRASASRHVLRLDFGGLLVRLLAAGLDIDARDREQQTPLFAAILGDGSVALVRALLAAGARIDVTCETYEFRTSLHKLINGWVGRKDLGFLVERIEREHPELAKKG